MTLIQILLKFKNFPAISVDLCMRLKKKIIPSDIHATEQLVSQIINLITSGSQTEECPFIGIVLLSRIFTHTPSSCVQVMTEQDSAFQR